MITPSVCIRALRGTRTSLFFARLAKGDLASQAVKLITDCIHHISTFRHKCRTPRLCVAYLGRNHCQSASRTCYTWSLRRTSTLRRRTSHRIARCDSCLCLQCYCREDIARSWRDLVQRRGPPLSAVWRVGASSLSKTFVIAVANSGEARSLRFPRSIWHSPRSRGTCQSTRSREIAV